ncbi:MAG: peptidoglycan-binding protein [Aquabacterium sp.]|uniref:ExeA family protein n=1 Tax=Aquabacterium sp. TaxID=1872578 RepID=UPI001200DB00|nr:AAA family ATPase [Aquabacterium sp.]TAK97408.1 MAG: peptidoglycan-binding protein [Aquabacterium sp.]
MYAQYFGLKQAPFSIAPDPRYLFMSERHREALAHLLYGVGGGGGFVVLTGEIGAGKTTVCRCFLEQIPRRTNVAYIFNPKVTVAELLKSVCDEFRIPYEHQGPGQATIKDYVDPLNEFLLKTHAVGQNNVLIIDEAQNLSPDVLEQLRLLTNLETSERKLLQIMLIGQPELRTMLAQPELEQLAQRVIAHFHLAALSEEETGQYIQHRLSIGGLKRGRLFDSKAVRRIHQLTGGVPRRINLLCDRALLGAYVENKSKVDRQIVDKAAQEVFQTAKPSASQHATKPAAADSQLDSVRRKKRRQEPWMPWLAGGMLFAAMAGIGGAAWLHQRQKGQTNKLASKDAPSAATPARPAASAQQAASSAPMPGGTMSTLLAAPPIDAHMVYQSAFRKEKDALRALAPMWQVTLGEGGDACTQAQQQSLACFRNSGGLALIRQLERPVILNLHDDHNQAIYALLIGVKDQTALLQFEGHAYALPLSTLASMWRGDFTTFWRTPPEFRMKILPGNTGPVVDWLAVQLSKIDKSAAPSGKQVFDAAMQSRVYAFQMAQGLKPDGVVGATTFMLINRAIGTEEPRLQTGQPGQNSPSIARRNDVLHP